MNKSESKYFNTAVRMDEAMLKLLEEKDFEYITVKEVCGAAGVNRSTFYLHYENTCDLLEESIEYMHSRFLSYFDVETEKIINKLKNASKQELVLITPDYLLPYLDFIRDHKSIYSAAMQNPRVFGADNTYGKMFGNIFDPILERFGVPEEERSYMMRFYLNGITALVSEWIKNDCKMPAEKIIEIIVKCIPIEK